MKSALVVFAVFAVASAFASQPGQPLDCSDWVFLEAGLSCVPLVQFPGSYDSNTFGRGDRRVIDSTGALYTLRQPVSSCSGCPYTCCGTNIELVRFDASGETVLAFIEDRDGAFPGNLD